MLYASPELVRGESLDERSVLLLSKTLASRKDFRVWLRPTGSAGVFTVGVLLFERLTDRHPFGTSQDGRLARLRRGEMGSGVNYSPAVPKQLRAILMRAMGPFPEERYLDLDSMVGDLARFVGDPALTRGQGSSRPTRPSFFEADTTVQPLPPELVRSTAPRTAAGDERRQRRFEEARTVVDPVPPIAPDDRPASALASRPDPQARPAGFFDAQTDVGQVDSSARPEREQGSARGEIVASQVPEAVPQRAADGAASLPAPIHAARTTQLPAHRATIGKLAPLLYIVLGAALASVVFLMLGRDDRDRGPSSGPQRTRCGWCGPRNPDRAARATGAPSHVAKRASPAHGC